MNDFLKKKPQNFEEFYPLLLNTEQTLNEVHSNNDWEQGSVYWNRHVCVFPCLIYSPSLPLFLWVTVVIKKHWKLILMSRSHVMITKYEVHSVHQIWKMHSLHHQQAILSIYMHVMFLCVILRYPWASCRNFSSVHSSCLRFIIMKLLFRGAAKTAQNS